MASLFITGSSGFIAAHLAQRLDLDAYDRITFLSRSSNPTIDRLCKEAHVTFVQGGLADAERYAEHLDGTDTVVHLAALTGKAKRDAYFETNAEGTAFFVRQCEQAGVQRFLHVSTIAVSYPDLSAYPYAQSKQQAEDIVKQSRMAYTIVRPTVVMGKDAAIWQRFRQLAQGNLIPVFGNGKALVQPIHVDDLVAAFLAILNERRFANETYDLGGPEQLTIDDLLRRIHQLDTARPPRLLHLPLGPILPLLKIGENVAFALLPFTAGQLSLFRFDSTVTPNPLHDEQAPRMLGVDAMLAQMHTPIEDAPLDEECRVFCRYLLGEAPTPYVLSKYRAAHEAHRLEDTASPFDFLLIRVARRSPWWARLADTYAALCYNDGVLRKKLVLLLAILESSPPTNASIDAGASFTKGRYYALLVAKGAGFALRLLLAVVVFLPRHLVLKNKPTPPDQPAPAA